MIKLGTGVLTSGIGELDTTRIKSFCSQVKFLQDHGIEIVIVSSGAIGLGMGRLLLKRRPKDLITLQACASIGQTILINTWQKGFDPHNIVVAQILLTREDLRIRHRYNAIFGTIERLLSKNIIPIINENDAISAEEIKFGDNDTLSALVASVIKADQLFILSNIPGLIDMQGTGKVIPYVEKVTPEIQAMAQDTKQVTSVGGMVSKLSAVQIAHRSGCGVTIADGHDSSLFRKLMEGEPVGTYFAPHSVPVKANKRWIATLDHVNGTLIVDPGAAKAIQKSGKSLLSAGIISSKGTFEVGDPIEIRAPNKTVIAQGLATINSNDLSDLLSLASDIQTDSPSTVVVHRDKMVLVDELE